jgi:NADPH-dependent curcumin reductase CurA
MYKSKKCCANYSCLQIGKLVGARVIAVTSGAAKADYLRGLGADAVVDAAAAPEGAPLHKLIRAVAPKGAGVRAAFGGYRVGCVVAGWRIVRSMFY